MVVDKFIGSFLDYKNIPLPLCLCLFDNHQQLFLKLHLLFLIMVGLFLLMLGLFLLLLTLLFNQIQHSFQDTLGCQDGSRYTVTSIKWPNNKHDNCGRLRKKFLESGIRLNHWYDGKQRYAVKEKFGNTKHELAMPWSSFASCPMKLD